MKLTYQYRVKNMNGFLRKAARKVNFVWNYCNDVQRQAVKARRKWLSGFDLANLTAGTSSELEISAQTIASVGFRYDRSRKQFKKPWLKWRSKKSLGWIPVTKQDLKYKNDNFQYMKRHFQVFGIKDRPLDGKICDGSSFSQDSRGRWYLNVVVDLPTPEIRPGNKSVGIDLGLKDFVVQSDGKKVENPRILNSYAEKLATFQKANKKKQVRNICAKIKNVRKDFQHKLSNEITKEFNNIFVGDVSSSRLMKTRMAKSVLDVSWYQFKEMLEYKSIRNGSKYFEVDEKFTTQTCSVCQERTGPKGLAGLNKRQWICSCGIKLDRDINSAVNILKRGLNRETPVEGKKDQNDDSSKRNNEEVHCRCTDYGSASRCT